MAKGVGGGGRDDDPDRADVSDEEELLIRKEPSPVRRRCRRLLVSTLLGIVLGCAVLLLLSVRGAAKGVVPLGALRGVLRGAVEARSKRVATPMVDGAIIEEDVERSFWSSKVMTRQMAVYEAECGCTRSLMAAQAQAHRALSHVLVIDGSNFRWEGLGNSGVRWMGLLRWGYATGRATFLKLTNDCSGAAHAEAHDPSSGRPSDATCHLDLGEYVTGAGGVDWRWGGARAAEVARRLRERSVREEVIMYRCKRHSPPGCATVALGFANGTEVVLTEPQQLRTWFTRLSLPWVRLVLQQADDLEHSYSKPESLRDVLPLTKCPIAGGADFSSRELVLKCETFANMQPRVTRARFKPRAQV